MLVFFIVISVILCFLWNTKVQFYEIRTRSKKLQAKVVMYKYERNICSRKDYTKLHYPYVKIIIEGEEQEELVRLRYAESNHKVFKIGEVVEVFWNDSDLLYWNAYENGFYKYLPNKWKFWET